MRQQKSWWRREFTGIRLVFNILFHGFHIGLFIGGWINQANSTRLTALNKLTFSVWMSRGAGLVLTLDGALILLPMCRNLLRWIRPKLRFLPLDESMWFHRQVAYSMLFWTIVHSASHYVNFFNIERTQVRPLAAVEVHYTQPAGITGHVMLLCMLLMYTTSHRRIRQQSFETFWYTHHLFIPFMLALYTHATGCFVRDVADPISPMAGKRFWQHCIGYQGWRWELVGGGLYFVERVYREIRSRRPTEITKIIKHPYDAFEIQFRKPSMKYKAGQWLFINVPSVSRGQWHPYTITSCPFDPYISIHIRQVGDWTRELADALGAGSSQAKLYEELDPHGMFEIAIQNGQAMPKIRIDGPYGAPAEDVFDHEVAILIGTGIGVTPWASILKNIWHLRSSPNPPRRLRRVEFYWICKDTTSFEWFQALLSSLEYQDNLDFLRIHTYLTQRLDADTAQNIVLNSVGSAKDPLTELRSRTRFGRPDFVRLFAAMRTAILDESYIGPLDGRVDSGSAGGAGSQGKKGNERKRADVGVYFCGPNPAAREVRKACRMANSDEVRFRFWKEHF